MYIETYVNALVVWVFEARSGLPRLRILATTVCMALHFGNPNNFTNPNKACYEAVQISKVLLYEGGSDGGVGRAMRRGVEGHEGRVMER